LRQLNRRSSLKRMTNKGRGVADGTTSATTPKPGTKGSPTTNAAPSSEKKQTAQKGIVKTPKKKKEGEI